MISATTSSILFIYDFRIIPEMFAEFQEWARTKGMSYWAKQEGVIRYQTFRKQSSHPPRDTTGELKGISKLIDVFSEVEIQSQEALDTIFKSASFQRMQTELLAFVEIDSLSHSVLLRAYDSSAVFEAPKKRHLQLAA